ncbi:MAG TPA: lipoate--protein ligase [Bacteroidales bacterium]|nr:lipoate--protein ligase [Bacteroidales bacterium]
MHLIISDSDKPFHNLAAEEFFLKQQPEEYILLSINDTSVVSGKHQCIHREVNSLYLYENNIPVLRRISGGGTVFHDKGNVNYCFIRNCESGKQVDFRRYTQPVIAFLHELGVDAVLDGSDIKVNGFKISGNAEHVYRNRVLHHGTLLWNASLERLRGSIRTDTSAYRTRAVASRPSPVTNLSSLLKSNYSAEQLRNNMAEYFSKTMKGLRFHNIPVEENIEIEKLSSKYKTWEWNYAYGPEYEFLNALVIGGKNVNCSLFVREGLIHECNIDSSSLEGVAEKLKGKRHMPSVIQEILEQSQINEIDYSVFF